MTAIIFLHRLTVYNRAYQPFAFGQTFGNLNCPYLSAMSYTFVLLVLMQVNHVVVIITLLGKLLCHLLIAVPI